MHGGEYRRFKRQHLLLHGCKLVVGLTREWCHVFYERATQEVGRHHKRCPFTRRLQIPGVVDLDVGYPVFERDMAVETPFYRGHTAFQCVYLRERDICKRRVTGPAIGFYEEIGFRP
ncbi:hypothetical protein D3C71_1680280 [compost metagenome]